MSPRTSHRGTAFYGERTWTGAPGVDEALDLLADHPVLEALARADDPRRVGGAGDAYLQGAALQLAAVPRDGHQQRVRRERRVARPINAVTCGRSEGGSVSFADLAWYFNKGAALRPFMRTQSQQNAKMGDNFVDNSF